MSFPEKENSFEENPMEIPRGGNLVKLTLTNQIVKNLLKDRALKIALFSLFTTIGVQHFQSEIEALLIDGIFKNVCSKDVEGELKVVCQIIEEHDLNSYAKSLQTLLVSNHLTNEQKINLLKIKLDYIINGECGGKTRFLVMIIIGTIMTFTLSGVGGLTLILEALYRLFQEGKISKALYKQILKALAKKGVGKNVPMEHLLED